MDIDIETGINRCREKGFEFSEIVVDMIMTSAPQLKDVDATNFKTLSMLFRELQIKGYYSAMNEVKKAKAAYKDVNFRHMVMPSDMIGSSKKPYQNDEEFMRRTFDLGLKDGKAANG